MTSQPRSNVPFYTLEEHWVSPALLDAYHNDPTSKIDGISPPLGQLTEIAPVRLAAMDAGNVAVQVVSHATAGAGTMHMDAEVRAANDQLATRVAAHPDRLRGFCLLAMAHPAEAAAEPRRCVLSSAPLSTVTSSSTPPPGGKAAVFYDSPAYDVLWAAAVELDVPIYLHPAFPPEAAILAAGEGLYAPAASPSSGDGPSTLSYSNAVAIALGSSAWGWHSNAGLGFLKLFAAGIFDRFPTLQTVLGHMGEMVPYFLERAERRLAPHRPAGSATLREAYSRNVHVTVGGYFSLNALRMLLAVTDASRVMHSND
ncbi:hypothetical protein GGTG_12411 [Gaeumannomyces tritici R3-111a-1]|uniref:Amidohydrolase-related domain-containing protein n=1 Tax=Gaeumannomyces tritici (strain R3-111a-1) TaxID=644352 RepID=J3PFY6_GAET3|nr:hypothetical protein GGTG_12411 [Gaeumannomyces tritici R3-111a-1]EJT70238.1 hypothetical protein GGTG_12411 [Gaeumannomyces tritici R3-111a-1]